MKANKKIRYVFELERLELDWLKIVMQNMKSSQKGITEKDMREDSGIREDVEMTNSFLRVLNLFD